MSAFGTGLLSSRVLFLDESGVRVLARTGTWKASSRLRGFAVAVLGPPYCAETVKEYPFRGFREIRAAAQLEDGEAWPAQVEQVFVMRSEPTGSETTGRASARSRVNLWATQGAWREALRGARPLFVVPEAAVFALAPDAGPHIYSVVTGTKTRYAFKDSSGLVRTLTYGEIRGSAVDLEGFRRTIGHEAAQCPVTGFGNIEEYERWLVSVLHAASVKRLWPFLDRKRVRETARRERQWLAIGAAAIGAIWAADLGWSAWVLHDREQRLAAEDKALSRNVGALIDKQDRARAQAERARALQGRVGAYASRVALLSLLERALPKGTTLDSVVLSGEGVELTGVAPHATDLLGQLQEEARVQHAEFVRPVFRDSRSDGERFQLRFEYRRPGKARP